jgi:AraC-like DNA-binding protein
MRSFGRNIVKYPINYAEFLLVYTVEPIEKIAERCGWANLENFIEIFEREVGVTPQHYRNWHHDLRENEEK